MMKTAALALAALALAAALPDVPPADTLIPEMSLVEELVPASPTSWQHARAEAVKTINFLQTQEGKDANACQDLADTTKKEVEESVSTQQKTLDSLDDGSDCPNSGMVALQKAQAAKAAAAAKLEEAQAEEEKAFSASVDFGSYAFSSLQEGQCGQFWSDGAYITVKTTHQAAVKARRQAQGELKAAEEALTAAEEAQRRAVLKCQCAVKSAEAKAWEAANANNDQDAKAYEKAEHMQCVLDNTPDADCVTGAVPTVTRKLLKIPANVDCSSFTTLTCPREKGFCVLPNNKDQNSGVEKMNSVDGNTDAAQATCLAECHKNPKATGCEVIWNQGNRGCYVHTAEVDHGNGVGNHYCWIFSKCTSSAH